MMTYVTIGFTTYTITIYIKLGQPNP